MGRRLDAVTAQIIIIHVIIVHVITIIKEQRVQLQNNLTTASNSSSKRTRLKVQTATIISIIIRSVYGRLVWVRVPAHVNLVLPLN